MNIWESFGMKKRHWMALGGAVVLIQFIGPLWGRWGFPPASLSAIAIGILAASIMVASFALFFYGMNLPIRQFLEWLRRPRMSSSCGNTP